MDETFKNKKVDNKKLLNFGFEKVGDKYFYSTSLLNGQFSLETTITKTGKKAQKPLIQQH